MHFVEQKYKLYFPSGIKNRKSHMQFSREEPCASAHIRITNQK